MVAGRGSRHRHQPHRRLNDSPVARCSLSRPPQHHRVTDRQPPLLPYPTGARSGLPSRGRNPLPHWPAAASRQRTNPSDAHSPLVDSPHSLDLGVARHRSLAPGLHHPDAAHRRSPTPAAAPTPAIPPPPSRPPGLIPTHRVPHPRAVSPRRVGYRFRQETTAFSSRAPTLRVPHLNRSPIAIEVGSQGSTPPAEAPPPSPHSDKPEPAPHSSPTPYKSCLATPLPRPPASHSQTPATPATRHP